MPQEPKIRPKTAWGGSKLSKAGPAGKPSNKGEFITGIGSHSYEI